MSKIKMLCFDMDGTIADLYGFENWLPLLRSENVKPYREAAPLWDMEELAEVLQALRANGIIIQVITWLSMNSSKSYKEATRQAKIEWLKEQNFPFDYFHGVQYGATKADSIRRYLNKDTEKAILFDDSEKVRKGWTLGEAIDPTSVDLIEYLKSLL